MKTELLNKIMKMAKNLWLLPGWEVLGRRATPPDIKWYIGPSRKQLQITTISSKHYVLFYRSSKLKKKSSVKVYFWKIREGSWREVRLVWALVEEIISLDEMKEEGHFRHKNPQKHRCKNEESNSLEDSSWWRQASINFTPWVQI